LGGRPVEVFTGGRIFLEGKELEGVVAHCQNLWEEVLAKAGNPHFMGIIRFDLVPHFLGAPHYSSRGVIDLGPLEVGGVYEINVHSPECGAALAAAAERGISVPPIFARIAEAIRTRFGNEIVFIPGSGMVKREWGHSFVRALTGAGLNLRVVHPDHLRWTPQIDDLPIWRWGDARMGGGADEFSLLVQAYLLGLQEAGGRVFNTLPRSLREDPGRKDLLPSFLPPSVDVLAQAQETPERFVIKPIRGSSGNQVVLGRLATREEWQAALEAVVSGEAGLFPAAWLPRAAIPGGPEVALDFNAAFWTEGDSIQYLYSIVRLDDCGRYWGRGVINVAKGAAFAPVFGDE
jgi:hypothetical protein